MILYDVKWQRLPALREPTRRELQLVGMSLHFEPRDLWGGVRWNWVRLGRTRKAIVRVGVPLFALQLRLVYRIPPAPVDAEFVQP